jgi:hypothetical protein
MQLNPELLTWLQSHPPGVSLANEQVAIAVNPGSEIRMAASAESAGHGAGRQGVALRGNQSPVKTFFQDPSTGTDVATRTGDLVFWTIAERTGLVQEFLPLERARGGVVEIRCHAGSWLTFLGWGV